MEKEVCVSLDLGLEMSLVDVVSFGEGTTAGNRTTWLAVAESPEKSRIPKVRVVGDERPSDESGLIRMI